MKKEIANVPQRELMAKYRQKIQDCQYVSGSISFPDDNLLSIRMELTDGDMWTDLSDLLNSIKAKESSKWHLSCFIHNNDESATIEFKR